MNKYVASCLQRSFPAEQWREAQKILALYCGDTLTFENHAYIQYMDEREIARRRSRIQLHVINMSEGDLDRLRQSAVREAQNARKPWDEMTFPYGDWLDEPGKLRGIETADYNNDLTLIRANLDAVGQAFVERGAIWNKQVVDQDIRIDRPFFLAFQLPGSPWTQLLTDIFREKPLENDWQRALSERLKTHVIEYGRSDTVSILEHCLYDSGNLLEKMSTDSDDWEYDQTFLSNRADVTVADLDEVSRFDISHQLFIEEEAYEPGIELSDLLCEPGLAHLPAKHRWKKVCIPDWGEDTRGDKGRRLLQRIDSIAFDVAT